MNNKLKRKNPKRIPKCDSGVERNSISYYKVKKEKEI
jgi:hypothetical protein